MTNAFVIYAQCQLAVGPEAIAPQWQVKWMTAKFGADESKWQTEGQWASEYSAIEQQHNTDPRTTTTSGNARFDSSNDKNFTQAA